MTHLSSRTLSALIATQNRASSLRATQRGLRHLRTPDGAALKVCAG